MFKAIRYSLVLALFIALHSICYGGMPSAGISQKAENDVNPTWYFEARQHLNQGLKFFLSQDYENAINAFTTAIDKYPHYEIAYSNRAAVYMQQQKFDKAEDDLKKGVEINPKNSTLHYNYVALYSLQGKIDRALDSLDRTLELGFNNYDALRKDPDLNNVRKHPEFRKICEKWKAFL